MMSLEYDTGMLYGSPEGHKKVIAHYDNTLNSMEIPFNNRNIETSFGSTQSVGNAPSS